MRLPRLLHKRPCLHLFLESWLSCKLAYPEATMLWGSSSHLERSQVDASADSPCGGPSHRQLALVTRHVAPPDVASSHLGHHEAETSWSYYALSGSLIPRTWEPNLKDPFKPLGFRITCYLEIVSGTDGLAVIGCLRGTRNSACPTRNHDFVSPGTTWWLRTNTLGLSWSNIPNAIENKVLQFQE